MEVEINAHAKINLALDVLREREDGYHDIDTIMQEVELHDTISIETGRGGIVLTTDTPELALNRSNLVYKAWDALKDRAEDPSVLIHIEKRIPVAAGLAGGSTDAAATLMGLNKLWNLGLLDDELMEIALTIGSDVPFFIRGGTCRAKGRGEELTRLTSFRGKPVVLVNNGKQISSKYVYDQITDGGEIPVDELVTYLENDSPKAYSLMQNKMEEVSLKVLPELNDIKDKLQRHGALVALMSGSGPTVFGIFENDAAADQAAKELEGRYQTVIRTRTI